MVVGIQEAAAQMASSEGMLPIPEEAGVEEKT